MTSNKTTIIWLIIAILLIVIVLLIFSRPVSAPLVSTTSSSTEIVSSSAPEETGNSTALIHATFVCPGGEVINAVFHNEENSFVDLALPDGRLLRVPQALSADGARYATKNEMFVLRKFEHSLSKTLNNCALRAQNRNAGAGKNSFSPTPPSFCPPNRAKLGGSAKKWVIG